MLIVVAINTAQKASFGISCQIGRQRQIENDVVVVVIVIIIFLHFLTKI
jgi:hypothetical protein